MSEFQSTKKSNGDNQAKSSKVQITTMTPVEANTRDIPTVEKTIIKKTIKKEKQVQRSNPRNAPGYISIICSRCNKTFEILSTKYYGDKDLEFEYYCKSCVGRR